MFKFFQENIYYLIPLILLSILIRIMYSFYAPEILATADSIGYYEIGQKMIQTGIPINESRPPTYPLFLNIAMLLQGKYHAPTLSPAFFQGMKTVVWLQTILSLISLIILYRIFLYIDSHKLRAYLFSLFIGFNIMLIPGERALLTESLATTILLCTTFILIKLIIKPKIWLFLILFLLYLVGLFLKPVFLAFPLFTLAFITLYHRTSKKILFSSFIIVALLLSMLKFYSWANSVYNNYPGFSRIGDINSLGQILYFDLPIDSAKGTNYFYNNVLDYRKIHGDPYPYNFLNHYDPSIYQKPQLLNQLNSFNFQVISHNLPLFIIKSVEQVPLALLSGNDIFKMSHKTTNPILNGFFQILFRLYNLFQVPTLIILPSFPFFLIMLLKKPTLKLAIITLIGLVAILQIFLTVPFVFYEFGRLLSPIQPELYLLSYYSWGKLLHSINSHFRITKNWFK